VSDSRVALPPGGAVAGLAMYSFVALGLGDGMIGTAWPALRHDFAVPLEDLGAVMLVAMLGAFASSSVAGALLARAGLRATMIVAATAGAVGAAGVVLSPAFWTFIVSGAFLGLASGLFDSGVNASVALAGRGRLLNVLHGCYGVGTMLGPLVVTAALLAGSWRPAYGVLLAGEVLLACGWWFLARRPVRQGAARAGAVQYTAVPAPAPQGSPSGSTGLAPRGNPSGSTGVAPRPLGRQPRRRRLVAVVGFGMVVFALCTGLEVAAGQWEPSFDRGPLHLGAGLTGVATFGYWGALTLVRFALAVPRRPLRPGTVVNWGCAVSLVGAALVWWRPSVAVAVTGLVVIGGSVAGVFPALVSLTPARVGEDMAPYVIGWQNGAAGLGGSLISAAFGAIFQRFGLRDFGPALVSLSVLLMTGAVLLQRAPALSASRES